MAENGSLARRNRSRRKRCSQRRFSHLLGTRKTTIRGGSSGGRERALLPARLVFISGLSEEATIQPHICIFTEPFTQLGGLLTDADGKAIFHKVRGKREKEKKQTTSKTKTGSGTSWKRCKTGSRLIENRNQIKLLDLLSAQRGPSPASCFLVWPGSSSCLRSLLRNQLENKSWTQDNTKALLNWPSRTEGWQRGCQSGVGTGTLLQD